MLSKYILKIYLLEISQTFVFGSLEMLWMMNNTTIHGFANKIGMHCGRSCQRPKSMEASEEWRWRYLVWLKSSGSSACRALRRRSSRTKRALSTAWGVWTPSRCCYRCCTAGRHCRRRRRRRARHQRPWRLSLSFYIIHSNAKSVRFFCLCLSVNERTNDAGRGTWHGSDWTAIGKRTTL